jgi:hypothetical protein
MRQGEAIMRPANDHEITIRDQARAVLRERGTESGSVRNFDDRAMQITEFAIRNGHGITINFCRPPGKASNVFCLHWRPDQTITLVYVAGSWEAALRQLAAECAPTRKIEAA